MRAELPVVPTVRTGLRVPEVIDATTIGALIGDRTRASILAMLRGGPCCVCEMAAAMGERENNVSNHLARLRAAGLVRPVRHQGDARWVYYERDEAACERAVRSVIDLLQ